MAAETDIELRMSLNPKGIKERTQQLQSEIQKVFNSVDVSKLDAQTRKALVKMQSLADKAAELSGNLSSMEDAFPKQVEENIQTCIDSMNQLNDLIENSSDISDSTKDMMRENAKEYEAALQYWQQIQSLLQSNTTSTVLYETNAEYRTMQERLNSVNDSMAALVGTEERMSQNMSRSYTEMLRNTNLIRIMGNGIELVGDKVQRLSRDMLRFSAQAAESGRPVVAALSGVASVLTGLSGRIIKTVGQITAAVGKIIKVISPAMRKMLVMAGSLIVKVGSGLVGAFKRLGSAIKSNLGGGAKQINQMGMTAKKLLGTLLGFASLRVVFNKLKSAIIEGTKELVMFNSGNNDVNAAITTMQASLTQLRNAWAAAFSPILTAVAPILNQLIALCVNAANAIGMLFAKLNGASTFLKAKKVQKDYAKSLDKTGKAAGAAADKLAKFDDLDVLDNGKGGGGAGGGADGLGEMFEEVPIDAKVNDWIDEMKKAWESADFTDLGNLIGMKLRDGLNKASDWLVDVAQPIAAKLGKSLATFLNGFFETEGLGQSVGRFFGELVNTWLDFEQNFLDFLHGRSIGKFIGDTIMSSLNTIDFTQAGHILAQKFNVIFDILGGIADSWDPDVVAESITDFVNTAIKDFHWAENAKSLSDFAIDLLESLRKSIEGVDWKSLGHGIATFINNIDWKTIAKELGTGLGDLAIGLLDLLITLLEETNWNQVGESIAEFINSIDWVTVATKLGTALGSFAKAILTVLTEALEHLDWYKIGDVIKGLITGIDWSGVAKALFELIGAAFAVLLQLDLVILQFLVDAWNKVVEWWHETAFEDGKFTIAGLLDGIINALVGIGTWIWDNVVSPIIEGFKSAFGIASPSTVMYELGVYVIEGLLNGIKSLVDAIKQIWEDLKSNAIQIWTNIKTRVVEIVTTLKQSIVSLWTKAKELVIQIITNLKDKAIDLWNLIKNKITELVTALKNNLVNLWNAIKTKITEIVTALKNKLIELWTALKDKVNEIVTAIKEGVISMFNNLKDTAISIFTDLKDTVVSLWNSLWEGIKTVINWILGGIEKMCNGIVSGVNRVTSALNGIGFDMPSWLGGGSFKLNIPQLNTISLPRLAQGAVIPPNREFLAMLGDQRQGTNIEAPLDTIKQAFADVVANMEVHNSGYSEMRLDGQTFARLVTPYLISELKREGFNVSVLKA